MNNSQLIQANKAFRFSVDITKATGELDNDFYVEGYAATSDLDRQGDIILEQALKDAAQQLVTVNNTVFFGHCYDLQNSVGRMITADVDNHGLKVKIFVSSWDKELRIKLKEGVISKFSIGGRVLTDRTIPRHEAIAQGLMQESQPFDSIKLIEKMELFEVSFVGVPANAHAQVVETFVKSLQNLYNSEKSQAHEKGGAVMEDVKKQEAQEVPQIAPPAPEVKKEEPKVEPVKEIAKAEEPKVEPKKEEAPKAEAKEEVNAEEIKDLLKDDPKAEAKPEEKPYYYYYGKDSKVIQEALVKIQEGINAILKLLEAQKDVKPEEKKEEPKANEEIKALANSVSELKAFITEKVKSIEVVADRKAVLKTEDPIKPDVKPEEKKEENADLKFFKYLTGNK